MAGVMWPGRACCVGGTRPLCTAVNITSHQSLVDLEKLAKLTLTTHSRLQTLLKPAVLALVSVMLIYGTISVASTRVGQVPPDGAFEERLATFTCELAVMFAATLVTTNNTFDMLRILV